MRFNVDNVTDSYFVRNFLEKYLTLGFANLPKKEIDILVFTLMMKFGYIEGKDYYAIAKELMIDEKKVKRMILESSLRNEKDDTVPSSMKSIQSKIFKEKKIKPEFEENKFVILMIDNQIERRDFVYALKLIGFSFDENLNQDRIKIPIHVFLAVFCKYDDEVFKNFKEKARKQIKNDSDWEKAFKEALPLTEKIKNIMELINLTTGVMSFLSS